MQEEVTENFGWRREKHKNNESFKLAVDDVVVCCALCGAFKVVILGLEKLLLEKSLNILQPTKAPPEF